MKGTSSCCQAGPLHPQRRRPCLVDRHVQPPRGGTYQRSRVTGHQQRRRAPRGQRAGRSGSGKQPPSARQQRFKVLKAQGRATGGVAPYGFQFIDGRRAWHQGEQETLAAIIEHRRAGPQAWVAAGVAAGVLAWLRSSSLPLPYHTSPPTPAPGRRRADCEAGQGATRSVADLASSGRVRAPTRSTRRANGSTAPQRDGQEAGDWQAPTMPAHYARHQHAAPQPAPSAATRRDGSSSTARRSPTRRLR